MTPARSSRSRFTICCFLAMATTSLAGCGNEGREPTLRVADQAKALQSMLGPSGEGQPKEYRLNWSNFLGGPSVIAAQTGGSIDLGWMAETPVIFAQAAGSPIKVVAVSQGLAHAATIALAVPADSPIRTPADLKGKKISFAPGTNNQYLVARVLERAGLTLGDVTAVHVQGASGGSLGRKYVDAYIISEPALSKALAERSIRVLAYAGAPNTPDFGYVVATDKALADPAISARICDFVGRAARAARWRRDNPTKAAPANAKLYDIPVDLAERIVRNNPTGFRPIDAKTVASHQEEADFFLRHGLIRARTDAAALFDHRCDAQVAQAEKAA